MQPVAAVDKGRLRRWIADLDNRRFAVRQTATRQLEKQGELAESVLRQALEAKPTTEARRRLERLLDRVDSQRRFPSGEHLRLLRALAVLENIGTKQARSVLEKLAKGAPEARLTQEAKAALKRMARRIHAKP